LSSTLRWLSSAQSDPVVLVDGVRTPFCVAQTDLQHLMPHELLAEAISGLIDRTGVDKSHVDFVSAGVVFQDVRCVLRLQGVRHSYPW
jgi:acetyl-CoA acetyltransferase